MAPKSKPGIEGVSYTLYTHSLKDNLCNIFYSKQGMLAHTCNPRTRDLEAGGPEPCSQTATVIVSDFGA